MWDSINRHQRLSQETQLKASQINLLLESYDNKCLNDISCNYERIESENISPTKNFISPYKSFTHDIELDELNKTPFQEKSQDA